MNTEKLKEFYTQQKEIQKILLSNESDEVINGKLKQLGVKLYAPKLKGIKTSQHMEGKSIDIDAVSVEENKKIENKY